MSEPLTNTQLKNRLLGAALLVVLAVLLIPLFLGEPKQAPQPIPKVDDNSGFQSKIQPLPDVQNKQNSVVQPNQQGNEGGLVLKKFDALQQPIEPPPFMQEEPVPLPAEKVSEAPKAKPKPEPLVNTQPTPNKVETVEKAVVKKPPQKPVEPKTPPQQKAAQPKQVASGWVVQAGIFSKAENAESIAKVLRSNGHKPNLSEARTSFGKATRVWIGPFKNKADAQALSKKIEQQTGNGGYVAEFPFRS